jgi:uncharacterized membrane protein
MSDTPTAADDSSDTSATPDPLLVELLARLDRIESRLELLEQRTGVRPLPASAIPPAPGARSSPAVPPVMPIAALAPDATGTSHTAAGALPVAALAPEAIDATMPVVRAPAIPPRTSWAAALKGGSPAVPPAPPSPPVSPVPAVPGTALNWEEFLGLRGALWAGAGVLLLGVIFFLVYAWDQGWLRPSPAGRVAGAFAVGVAMHVAAWRLRARRSGFELFASVIHALATAVLVATSLAGYAAFREAPVLTPLAARAAAWAAIVAGLFAAWRLAALTPAIVAVLGALLIPLILHDEIGTSLGRQAHVWAIAALAGVMACRLRTGLVLVGLAAAGVALWTTYHLFGVRPPADPLLLCGMGWAVLVWPTIAVDRQLRRGGASTSFDDLRVTPNAVLAALVGGGAWLMLYTAANAMGLPKSTLAGFTVALFAAHAALAWVSHAPAQRVTHLALAAVLLTLLPPILTDGLFVGAAWLAMAGVAAAVAWTLKSEAVRFWAGALWGLVVLRLFVYDRTLASLGGALFTLDGLSVTRWLAYAWGVGVAGVVIAAVAGRESAAVSRARAKLGLGVAPDVDALGLGDGNAAEEVAVRPSPGSPADQSAGTHPLPARERAVGSAGAVGYRAPSSTPVGALPDAPPVFATVAVLVPIAATAMLSQGRPLTAAAVLAAMVLVVAAVATARASFCVAAAGLCALAGGKWLFSDTIVPLTNRWNDPSAAAGVPFLNADTLSLATVLAGLLAAWWAERRVGTQLYGDAADAESGVTRTVASASAAVLLFVWVSDQSIRVVDAMATAGGGVDRIGQARQVTLSVVWAVLGFAGIVVGFVRNLAAVRYLGLGLLAITLGKVLLIDMAGVAAVWRILSFLTLGALLLAVSFIYHKHQSAQRTPAADEAPRG